MNQWAYEMIQQKETSRLGLSFQNKPNVTGEKVPVCRDAERFSTGACS